MKNSKPKAETKEQNTPLSDQQLKSVTGGSSPFNGQDSGLKTLPGQPILLFNNPDNDNL